MTITNVPALRTFWPIVATTEATLAFLIHHRVFWIPTCCPSCSGPMSIQGKNARCIGEGCRKSSSLFLHSFFANSRIPIHDSLLLGYLWVNGATYSMALGLTAHSPNTVVDYYRHFRQLVTSALGEEDSI